MPSHSTAVVAFRYAAVALVLLVAGCTHSDALESATAVKMRHIARVYLDYAVAKGRGPASASQLRTHAKYVSIFDPRLGDTSPLVSAAPLVSERDGQELVIRYGEHISFSSDGDAPPIVFEQRGQDGYALVAFANGTVDCVDRDQVDAWLAEMPPIRRTETAAPQTAGL